MNNNVRTLKQRLLFSLPLSPLFLYILAAMFARIATGGSAVAIVLLARDYGADGTMVGILAACLTAPHVLGPLYGRWLDEVRDTRIILAATSVSFAAFFQLAILGFNLNLHWLTMTSLLVCGVCSSFMMGGLSTQLTHLVDEDVQTRRRAQSMDTSTYGFGLTVGPLIVALFGSLYPLQTTVALLMSLPVVAGVIILCLPRLRNTHERGHEEALGFRDVINIMARSSALKRTFAMTAAGSFAVAALPVIAVYLSEAWQHSREDGAFMVTAYGVGCLCGAFLLMLRPMKADAVVLLRNVGLLLLVTLILVAASASFMMGMLTYWLCGVVNSIFF